MSDDFRAKEFSPPLPAPTAVPTPPPQTDVRHLLIIGRRETQLYRHFQAALATDAKTVVLMDRRCTDTGAPAGMAERRRPTTVRRHLQFHFLKSVCVDIIVRDEARRSDRSEESVNNGELVVVNDRERVERWVEDSKYVVGRLIPELLEDRDRWRTKAESVEQENERLRYEIGVMRKDLAERESERQHIGAEQAAIAQAFSRVMEHLTQLQQPLNDAVHRLHSMQPAAAEVNAG